MDSWTEGCQFKSQQGPDAVLPSNVLNLNCSRTHIQLCERAELWVALHISISYAIHSYDQQVGVGTTLTHFMWSRTELLGRWLISGTAELCDWGIPRSGRSIWRMTGASPSHLAPAPGEDGRHRFITDPQGKSQKRHCPGYKRKLEKKMDSRSHLPSATYL